MYRNGICVFNEVHRIHIFLEYSANICKTAILWARNGRTKNLKLKKLKRCTKSLKDADKHIPTH